MINGIKPVGLKCSRCDDTMPSGRLDMGYTICTKCSTEEKVSCHTIYPHKTGGYIQVVSKEASDTTYDTALKQVLDYYDEWGYEPTLQYLRQLNSSGDIPLMTRGKIQDVITDKYLEPSPRALTRHFNK